MTRMKKLLGTIFAVAVLSAALVVTVPASPHVAQAHGSCTAFGDTTSPGTTMYGAGRTSCDYAHYETQMTVNLQMYNPSTGTWQYKGRGAYVICLNGARQCPTTGVYVLTSLACTGATPYRTWRVAIGLYAKKAYGDPWQHVDTFYRGQNTHNCWV